MAATIYPSWASIIVDLYHNGPSSSLDIACRLDRSQTAVSKNLNKMLKRGYVTRERQGRYLIYHLGDIIGNDDLVDAISNSELREEDAANFWIPKDALAIMCDTARRIEVEALCLWMEDEATALEDRGSADDEREAIILRRKVQEIRERAPFVRGISNGKLN